MIFDTPDTPYRSKTWHDAGNGTRDRLNVAVDARVLHALAAQHDWLDGTKCGVSGHSWGGHAAAMAMLLAPDTYVVGVSSAGLYDPQVFFLDASEKSPGSPGLCRWQHHQHRKYRPGVELLNHVAIGLCGRAKGVFASGDR